MEVACIFFKDTSKYKISYLRNLSIRAFSMINKPLKIDKLCNEKIRFSFLLHENL